MNTNILEAPNLNLLWTALMVEECVRSGVTLFCISPGSRSTPLVAAVAQHPKAETMVCLDERAAAFYALGYARATGKPAALICTSGTAVANYLPAVVEAAQDCVPMLILTADRPPELRDTGANQTVPQPAMFGEFVRWKFDMPCPDLAIAAPVVLTTIDQAIFRALNSPAGPVHLNCMFREPLAPVLQPFPQDYLAPLREWVTSSRPWTNYVQTHLGISLETAMELAEMIRTASFPLLCVGRVTSLGDVNSVTYLAKMFGVPVVADIASGLRDVVSSEEDETEPLTILHYFDQMLLVPSALETVKPDLVLHIGGGFVSKRLLQWLGSIRPASYIVVEQTPFRHDPNHQVTMRIMSDIGVFTDMLEEGLYHVEKPKSKAKSKAKLKAKLLVHTQIRYLAALSEVVEKTLLEVFAEQKATNAPLSEMAVAHTVSAMIPTRHGLFLSNSMPIRDMDMYAAAPIKGDFYEVGTNRGASGIDGIVATAAGFARGIDHITTLIIGDVALIHDLNSLLLVAKNPVPLVIIVINNAGGGIFSFLPIAAHTDIFEPFWGTPHDADFRAGALFAGLRYILAERLNDFAIAYQAALGFARKEKASVLIEVRTDRAANLDEHKRLQALIASRLEDAAQ